MGCFNQIGFLSNAPIEAGDSAVLVFVKQYPYRDSKLGGCTYADDIFTPVLLPIFGEYDDYGKIENVKRTLNVQIIEDYFGIDIDTIIEEVDDHMVGRSGGGEKPKLTTKKNKELYKKLAFCLDHERVFKMMSGATRPSWTESNIGSYWLTQLGWVYKGKSTDERYKHLYEHPEISKYKIHCDNNWSHLVDTKGKQVQTIVEAPEVWGTYNPYQLHHVMMKLGVDPKISKEQTEFCMVDLSYKITAEHYIKENRDNEGEDADRKYMRRWMREPGRWPQGIYGLTEILSNNQNELSDFIKNIISGEYKLEGKTTEELVDEMRQEITDYIRFNMYVFSVNLKYFPSNYGNQEQSYKKQIKLFELSKQIVEDKIKERSDYDKEDEGDGEVSEKFVIEFTERPEDVNLLNIDKSIGISEEEQKIKEVNDEISPATREILRNLAKKLKEEK